MAKGLVKKQTRFFRARLHMLNRESEASSLQKDREESIIGYRKRQDFDRQYTKSATMEPEITAQQKDQGLFSDDAGNRLYSPCLRSRRVWRGITRGCSLPAVSCMADTLTSGSVTDATWPRGRQSQLSTLIT